MQTLATFIIWLVLLVLISRLLDRLLSEIFPKGRYRWVIWPGIAVHEASHAIMAKAMLAKITDISLFSKTGGSVTHTRPKVPIVGTPLISMAPLFGCVIAIVALSHAFGFDGRLIMAENLANWRFWLFLYLVLAVSAAIAPSNQDFRNSWWGIGLILITLFLLIHFGYCLSFLERALAATGSLFALGVAFEVIVLVLISPFWLWRRKRSLH